MKTCGKYLVAVLAVLTLLATGCGSDVGGEAGGGSATPTSADSGDAMPNACPTDGCQIDFESITKSGEEIAVEWKINFDPDIASNHIHIYWDSFTAAQVSNDAAERNVEQGEWVPTDEAPIYTTSGAVSTSVRGESTVLCLVAADRDHNVIDESAQVCQDVTDYLPPADS